MPSVESILIAARAKLAPSSDTGKFNSVFLRSHLETALRLLSQEISKNDIRLPLQRRWINVPANYSFLPTSKTLFDSARLKSVWFRGIEGEIQGSIASDPDLTPGLPSAAFPNYLTITLPVNPYITGDQLIVTQASGVDRAIEGPWTITVLTPTTLRLNGATVAWPESTVPTAPSLTLSRSADSLRLLDPAPSTIDLLPNTPPSSLPCGYIQELTGLRISPCTQTIQYAFDYLPAMDIPTPYPTPLNDATTDIAFPEATLFLSTHTAGLAGRSMGHTLSGSLLVESSGSPAGVYTDGAPSHLTTLIRTLLQRSIENGGRDVRSRPFRPRAHHI